MSTNKYTLRNLKLLVSAKGRMRVDAYYQQNQSAWQKLQDFSDPQWLVEHGRLKQEYVNKRNGEIEDKDSGENYYQDRIKNIIINNALTDIIGDLVNRMLSSLKVKTKDGEVVNIDDPSEIKKKVTDARLSRFLMDIDGYGNGLRSFLTNACKKALLYDELTLYVKQRQNEEGATIIDAVDRPMVLVMDETNKLAKLYGRDVKFTREDKEYVQHFITYIGEKEVIGYMFEEERPENTIQAKFVDPNVNLSQAYMGGKAWTQTMKSKVEEWSIFHTKFNEQTNPFYPLLQNIIHLMIKESDLDTAMQWVGPPVIAITGSQGQGGVSPNDPRGSDKLPTTTGARNHYILTNKDASIKYLEHTGSAFDTMMKRIENILFKIEKFQKDMIQGAPVSSSATEAKIKENKTECKLDEYSGMVNEQFNRAISLALRGMKLTGDEIKVELEKNNSQDFMDKTLYINTILSFLKGGVIEPEVAVLAGKRIGIMSKDYDRNSSLPEIIKYLEMVQKYQSKTAETGTGPKGSKDPRDTGADDSGGQSSAVQKSGQGVK